MSNTLRPSLPKINPDGKVERYSVPLTPETNADLDAYARFYKAGYGVAPPPPPRLIALMVEQFLAGDRDFTKFKQQQEPEATAKGAN